jgi:hypothetical protein
VSPGGHLLVDISRRPQFLVELCASADPEDV